MRIYRGKARRLERKYKKDKMPEKQTALKSSHKLSNEKASYRQSYINSESGNSCRLWRNINAVRGENAKTRSDIFCSQLPWHDRWQSRWYPQCCSICRPADVRCEQLITILNSAWWSLSRWCYRCYSHVAVETVWQWPTTNGAFENMLVVVNTIYYRGSSLSVGRFAAAWKNASFNPLRKKAGLYLTMLFHLITDRQLIYIF